jgi:hypothetical protein|tara:strand:- start:1430 stop:1801 length:372 start_codon:yes stop_codon:yes gene_type:complete
MNDRGLESDVLDDIDLFLDGVSELNNLECNAAADLISYELERESIPHQRVCGSTRRVSTGEVIFPHCWIELPNGEIIDTTLRLYFPFAEDVPNGRFRPCATYQYKGTVNPTPRLNERLISQLS